MAIELSKHALDMLKERKIHEEWIWMALENQDWKETKVDGNIHYFKSIPEHDNRLLHVIVNQNVLPNRVVTVFFDRKARRPK